MSIQSAIQQLSHLTSVSAMEQQRKTIKQRIGAMEQQLNDLRTQLARAQLLSASQSEVISEKLEKYTQIVTE